MMPSMHRALNAAADTVADLIVILRDAVRTHMRSIHNRRSRRIEAELDRKQEELRATVLQLAEALGADAHEARRALIRESFLARGEIPDATSGRGRQSHRY